MYSNLLALMMFYWILVAGAMMEHDDLNSMQFYQITGRNKLFRYQEQNLGDNEAIFKHNDSVQIKNYLALTSRNLFEKLEVESYQGNKEPVPIPDTYVHFEGRDFLLTNLTWGAQDYDLNTDLLMKFQSCSVDSNKNASSLRNRQLITHNVNFIRILCVQGLARKIGEDASTSETENAPDTDTHMLLTKQTRYGTEVIKELDLKKPHAALENFTLIVQGARVEVLFDRLATNTRGIVSTLQQESLTLERLLFSDPHKKEKWSTRDIKSVDDEMFFLQKLADSWMLLLMNAINNRYLKPKMLELNQLQFQGRQKYQLELIGSIILNSLTKHPHFFPGERLEKRDEILSKHPVGHIELKNFEQFYVVSFSWTNLSEENGDCPLNGEYTHTLDFNYYAKTEDKSRIDLPSINWYHKKEVIEGKLVNVFFSDSNFSVTDFSVQLTINTDKLGRVISTAVRTHLLIDEEMDLYYKKSFRHSAAILEETETLMSESFEKELRELV